MIPEWVNKYVGLPFGEKASGTGYDCWGLARLVLSQEYGIILPSYEATYDHSLDRTNIQATYAMGVDEWVTREQEWTEVTDPVQCGDLAFFHVFGHLHCGILLDKIFVLHVLKGTHACCSRYRDAIWRSRLISIYRHRSCCTG